MKALLFEGIRRVVCATVPDPSVRDAGDVVFRVRAERLWYARQAMEHGWSHNTLALQIYGRAREQSRGRKAGRRQ